MDPILGGVLSGSLGLIGSLVGTSQNNRNALEMQQQAQQFNAAQTLQQQQFQEQMSSSAYQRASKDMTAAGLNPAMMFSSGSAASTPSGAAATTQPAQKTSAWGQVGPAMDRIVSSAIAAKTFDKMTDEIANLKSLGDRIKAETLTEQERKSLVHEQSFLTTQEAAKTGHEIGTARARAVQAKAEEDLMTDPWGRRLVQSGKAGQLLSNTLAPIGDVVHSAGGVMRTLRGLSSHNFDMRWP